MRWSSSNRRSRRTVASETSRREARAPTSTAPSTARTCRISLRRSARRTRRIYAAFESARQPRKQIDRLLVSALQFAKVSETEQEVASQPDMWRRAVDLAPRVADALPSPDERVAVVGCGTSLYIARAFAARRESGGSGETDAFAASEFPMGRSYDRVVAISRSGTTSEVVRLL